MSEHLTPPPGKPVAGRAYLIFGKRGNTDPVDLALVQGLLFTPLIPCRIVDTRIAGGPIAANSQRSFLVNRPAPGVFYSGQGGSSTSCDIPLDARSVLMNFTVVSPGGPGYLRAFAFGQPTTNTSTLNYAAVPELNIANGLAVQVCLTGTCTFDLTAEANQSGTDLVIDVFGYFR